MHPHRARTDTIGDSRPWVTCTKGDRLTRRPRCPSLHGHFPLELLQALIAYQEKTRAIPSPPRPHSRTALDWIWTDCWNASARAAFAYTNIESAQRVPAGPSRHLSAEPAHRPGLLHAWCGTYRAGSDTEVPRSWRRRLRRAGSGQAWLVECANSSIRAIDGASTQGGRNYP